MSWYTESLAAYDQIQLFFLTDLPPKTARITRKDDRSRFISAKKVVGKDPGDGNCPKIGDDREDALHVYFACLAYCGTKLPHPRSICPDDRRGKSGKKSQAGVQKYNVVNPRPVFKTI